jgi:hypothetical protein
LCGNNLWGYCIVIKRGLPYRMAKSLSVITLSAILLAVVSGCSAIMTSATSDMMAHLSKTIMNCDDLKLVETGAPAYLLMIDSLISKDPDNEHTLATAALLYAAYADVFVKNPRRAKKMSAKALEYAKKSVCLSKRDACGLQDMTFDAFGNALNTLEKKDVHALFALGQAWGGWILAHQDEPDAIADLSRIETIMKRVIDLDKTFKQGAPHLYLGMLSSFLPPALGGRPEEGKTYFEEAIRLSSGKNLSAKMAYAQFYARNIFDRDLHDRLLEEVISADPYVDGHTLINVWAQQQAQQLLEEADDFF